MTDSLKIWGTDYTGVKGFKAKDSSNNQYAYLRPQGAKSITSNGNNIDVAEFATVNVSVSGGGGTIVSKSITENGTYNASSDNADGYSPVTVNVPNAFTISDVSNTSGTTAQITAGTGGGGATQHEIHLEFTDSTDTDIEVDYDDSYIATIITSYSPTTYGQKTVSLAQLDGVTWYEYTPIPIGVQLVDYTTVSADTAINQSGAAYTEQWYYTSDYIPAEAGMGFSYRASYWHYIAFYNESKTCLGAFIPYQGGGTQDPNDTNTGYGLINAQNVPAGTKYIRLCGTGADSDHMSLIRTA